MHRDLPSWTAAVDVIVATSDPNHSSQRPDSDVCPLWLTVCSIRLQVSEVRHSTHDTWRRFPEFSRIRATKVQPSLVQLRRL